MTEKGLDRFLVPLLSRLVGKYAAHLGSGDFAAGAGGGEFALNNPAENSTVSCGPHYRKECIEESFSCGADVRFKCFLGEFECASNEYFKCSNSREGGERSGSTDEFQCFGGPDEGQDYECNYEGESFKCDAEMFHCFAMEKREEPFSCAQGPGHDFDCTNSETYDFFCGRGNNPAKYECDSEITNGFECDASHVFGCEGDFDCTDTHTCSPQGGVCVGDWCPPPQEHTPDDGKPSDFWCRREFDCGEDGQNPSGEFNCTAQSEFLCRHEGSGAKFECHRTFTCKPTDGPGYEDASFVCVDGAFECEEFDCTGDTERFRCTESFECDESGGDSFNCQDFDCTDASYYCKPVICHIPPPPEYTEYPGFECEIFDCTGGFDCSGEHQFGGCSIRYGPCTPGSFGG